MKPLFYFTGLFSILSISVFSQNVGINPVGTTPNTSSILDLNTGNTFTNPNGKGLIVPNVALTATNASNPVAGPATSLLVYNTATAGVSPNNVVPGYYYWDGAKWVAFTGIGSNDWSLLGNGGITNPAVPATYGTSTIGAAENWLGTTDSKDIVFGTNNIERMRVKQTTGYVGIGSAAPSSLLTVGTAATVYGASFLHTVTGTANGYLGSLIQNNSAGTGAWGELAIAADNTQLSLLAYSTGNTQNANLQQNRVAIISEANSAGLDLVCNKVTAGNGDMRFYTNGYSSVAAERMRILQSGYIGIGTTNPGDALVVKVPAASAINAITADVTAGNGNGNAISAASTGVVSVSTIFAEDKPTADGTGVPINTSNHAINGQINTSHIYSYGVYGTFQSAGNVLHAGGVVGYYNFTGNWGGLGYYSGFACYGGYFSGSNANQNGGAGKLSNSNTISIARNIGIGAYGDLFGGWVRGNIYGLAVKGERFSLFVDGKTIVNQPIIELTKTADNKTIVNYTPVSSTADLQLHGVVQMEKGTATITIDAATLNQFASLEDMTIIATPSGQTNGVYAELRNSKLIIKENNNGASTTKVSWIMIGKRNIEENFVPSEVQDKDFNDNLKGFMHNENDNSTPGNGLWWDGTKLNKGISPR